MHRHHGRGSLVRSVLVIAGLISIALVGRAPVARAEGDAEEEKPTIKVGGTIFADYTYTIDPMRVVEGEEIHPNAFNVTRAYVNVTGKVSKNIGFRITPDIFSPSNADSSSLVGSQVFRLKYAYAQFELADWITEGSFVRLGVQQTPYVDYIETIYRYRFQGTVFVDREGKLSASDRGVSAKAVFPGEWGDVHVGVYNGETYARNEANDQKAIMARVAVRPMPGDGPLHGLRLAGFIDADNYAAGDARTRFVGALTFEHAHLNAGFEFMGAKDQVDQDAEEIESEGFSVWATPKVGNGWEALGRYDELKPNKDDDDVKKKTMIGGVAYWFPVLKGANGALLVDYQHVEITDTDDQNQVALHGLLSF